MSQKYELKQWIWTDEDFDKMRWHDCAVHALSFPRKTFDLVIDIDYIFEWIKPTAPAVNFNFWIAPATLVFENVHDVVFDFDFCNDIQIDSIKREKPIPVAYEYIHRDEEWLWTVSCHRGEINLRSTGFKQYIRSAPVLTDVCILEMRARGGNSFERIAKP